MLGLLYLVSVARYLKKVRLNYVVIIRSYFSMECDLGSSTTSTVTSSMYCI